ncbi:uncharacterized protein LOC144303802 isoform X2 [Canis aureus]
MCVLVEAPEKIRSPLPLHIFTEEVFLHITGYRQTLIKKEENQKALDNPSPHSNSAVSSRKQPTCNLSLSFFKRKW